MEITDIRVRLIENGNKLKAVASLVFDGEIIVHDIKIIHSNDKLFISMPNNKTPDGNFKDIVNPVNQETRDKLTKIILEKYEALTL